jgi:dihydroorotate dehydrogenase electron transfer subunit
MIRTKSHLIENIRCAADAFILRLDAPDVAFIASPGQFLMVQTHRKEAILRRPFCISDVEGGEVSLLIREVGEGTKHLRNIRRGETLDIIAPLGKGFSIPEKGSVLLVAGGIGIAPFIFLIRRLNEKGVNTTLVFGCKTKDQLYLASHLKRLCSVAVFATEDGSYGDEGTALDSAKKILSDGSSFDFVYTCGPRTMVQGVARLAREFGLVGEASLEERMACGIGVCLCCSTRLSDGSKIKLCSDGPVVSLSRLV